MKVEHVILLLLGLGVMDGPEVGPVVEVIDHDQVVRSLVRSCYNNLLDLHLLLGLLCRVMFP
jgi:hypothetical protein